MKSAGMRGAAAAVMVVVLLAAAPSAGEAPPAPGKDDKCPVCGMFVAPYPEWTAAAVHRDGTVFFFDGAKDMFKYLLNMEKYGGSGGRDEIIAVFVTDYYTARLVKAAEVHFVTGSKVHGPMGRELVPVSGDLELKEFLKDYGGTSLKYRDISPDNIP